MPHEVVPYIGTWIETLFPLQHPTQSHVVPYIGTWIETHIRSRGARPDLSRTLYRYVD